MGIKELPRVARFIPKIMLAITVTACDEVYRKIACWLNDMGESQDIWEFTSGHLSFEVFVNTVFNKTEFYGGELCNSFGLKFVSSRK